MKYYIYTSKMHNQGIYLSVCVNKVLIKYRIENFDLATKNYQVIHERNVNFSNYGNQCRCRLSDICDVIVESVLRLMYFSGIHTVSLFITSNILPINMLYVEIVCSLTGWRLTFVCSV